jgi:hypothetical protein
MSGYFAALAARALGRAPTLVARPRFRFETIDDETGLEVPDNKRAVPAAIRRETAPAGSRSTHTKAAAEVPVTRPPQRQSHQPSAAPPTVDDASRPGPSLIAEAASRVRETVRVEHHNTHVFTRGADRPVDTTKSKADSPVVPAAMPAPGRATPGEPTPVLRAHVSGPVAGETIPSLAQREAISEPAQSAQAPHHQDSVAGALRRSPEPRARFVEAAPAPPRDRKLTPILPVVAPVVVRIGRIDVHAPARAVPATTAPPVRETPPHHAGPSLDAFLSGAGRR